MQNVEVLDKNSGCAILTMAKTEEASAIFWAVNKTV